MLAAPSPISSNQLIQPAKNSRKPLQPKNPTNSTIKSKPKPKPSERVAFAPVNNSNKENLPPIYSTPTKDDFFRIEPFDASLAEELSAIRQKLERLKIDKESTERMLKDRGLTLDLRMKEILSRWDVQKQLEVEVDRLYRLKEIQLSCTRISLLRSLRDKDAEMKMKQEQLKANNKTKDEDEKQKGVPLQSSNSEVNTEN